MVAVVLYLASTVHSRLAAGESLVVPMKTKPRLEGECAVERGDPVKRTRAAGRGIREESGQALILVVLSLFVLMGFLGLAIDVGNIRSSKQKLQGIADATALAGAVEISYCNGLAVCSDMQTATQNAGTENGFSTTTVTFETSQCTIPTGGSGNLLILNNGPCLVGSADPNDGNTNVVETLAQMDVPVYFASIVGLKSPVRISARSEAGLGNYHACVFDHKTEVGTGGKFNAPCGIQVDGNVTDQHNGGACNGSQIFATEGFNVSGTACSSNQITPAPVTSAPTLPDPLQYLTTNDLAPAPASCTDLSTSAQWSKLSASSPTGYKSLGNGETITLQPGTYCAGSSGTALEISSGDSLDLLPGTFVFGGNVQLDGTATLQGNPDASVPVYGHDTNTLYFTSGTLVITSTNASVNLYAPTDTCGQDTLGGILLWMASGNTSTFNLVNGAKNTYTGTVYAPSGTVDIQSGSNLGVYTLFDANTIVLGDGGTTNVNNNYSSLACGSPFKEATAVLVE